MSLLLNQTIVARSQPTTSILTPKYHGHNQQCHGEANETARNKHILEAISLHPRNNSEWDADTDSVAEKGNTRERVAANLDQKVKTRNILE